MSSQDLVASTVKTRAASFCFVTRTRAARTSRAGPRPWDRLSRRRRARRYRLTVPIGFDRIVRVVVPEWDTGLQDTVASPEGLAPLRADHFALYGRVRPAAA